MGRAGIDNQTGRRVPLSTKHGVSQRAKSTRNACFEHENAQKTKNIDLNTVAVLNTVLNIELEEPVQALKQGPGRKELGGRDKNTRCPTA